MEERHQHYEREQVLLVRFPFSDLSDAKIRPAIVVSSGCHNAASPNILVMAITSNLRPDCRFRACIIRDWQAVPLLVPSCVALSVVTLSKRLVCKKIGRMTARDMANVDSVLGMMLGIRIPAFQGNKNEIGAPNTMI